MNKLSHRHILFSFLVLPFFTPKINSAQKISGRVLNEGGKGATYVTVRWKDKSSSVYTNDDGTFTIVAKQLPDTLYFSAPGFEPYKVKVTEETARDPHFEVVLLNTRRKIKSSDAASTMTAGSGVVSPNNSSGGKPNTAGNQGISAPGAGGYISGKKLLMIDSVANNNSIMYRAGLLAAGEVNDFNKWRLWEDFSDNEFKLHGDYWSLYPRDRYCVQVLNKDHMPLVGERVFLIKKNLRDTVWAGVSDNTGKAELWAEMRPEESQADYLISCAGAPDINSPVPFMKGINKIELDKSCRTFNAVDIAMVVDATGSMTNEIDFLKIELEEVIKHTFAEYKDLDLHVGSVFYRDKGDEFVTKYVDLKSDLLKVLNFIKLQRAGGGGDVPEAVHLALQTALDSLHWNSSTRTRILFLVTDAPPHEEAKDRIFELLREAAAKGVRIVPVICRGADKSTEFIMRTMALATNGTYVFLTDDANAEFVQNKTGPNLFYVQFLNSLLERIIRQMVFSDNCAASADAEISKNIPGNVENIKVFTNTPQTILSIECSNPVIKELLIADFTGKVLRRIETSETQTKWSVDLHDLPNGTYLVRYIAKNDESGAQKFVLNR